MTGEPASVACHLADLLEHRDMTLVELSERVGVTVANLSVLKNDRARAIRFTTLVAICDALDCQPGDLLSVTSTRTAQADHDAERASASP